MDHGEGVLALIQVFGEALLLGVVGGSQVLVVVADLEEAADEAAHQVQVVVRHLGADGAFGQHQSRQHAEQAPGFLVDHFQILGCGGAEGVVRPVEVVALAHVQLARLFDEDAEAQRVAELGGHAGCLGELVRCAVDCLGGAVDGVRRGFATTKR